MTDENFFREVSEELRKEKALRIWDRYGPLMIAAAVAVVIATAAYVGWNSWVENRASASGDAFSQALDLANTGKNDEALAALTALEKDGYADYPVLARLRAATVLGAKGDWKGAVAAFDAVSSDGAVPGPIRDMATLRAALLLVDAGSYADVSSRAEQLTGDTNPLRHSAREALGLSAWKEGRASDALKLFDQIAGDDRAPRNARQRASLMAELIRGGGAA